MPKIIDALRERLLAEARLLLLRNGDLTIRTVAMRCGVAVGTVYNYFDSKDDLMAHVMLADWQQLLRAMETECTAAPDALTGLRAIFEGLRTFRDRYRDVWDLYSRSPGAHEVVTTRHPMVVDSLCTVISPMLQRFGVLWHPCLPTFLVETLLTSSTRGPDDFDLISPIFQRLLQAED